MDKPSRLDNKIEDEIFEMMSPLERAKQGLILIVGEELGREAMPVARRLFREQRIDLTSPDFDKQTFLDEVEKALKA